MGLSKFSCDHSNVWVTFSTDHYLKSDHVTLKKSFLGQGRVWPPRDNFYGTFFGKFMRECDVLVCACYAARGLTFGTDDAEGDHCPCFSKYFYWTN